MGLLLGKTASRIFSKSGRLHGSIGQDEGAPCTSRLPHRPDCILHGLADLEAEGVTEGMWLQNTIDAWEWSALDATSDWPGPAQIPFAGRLRTPPGTLEK